MEGWQVPTNSSNAQQQENTGLWEVTAGGTLPIQDIFDGCTAYRPIKYLGSGSSGFVFMAEHIATGRQVALKFVEKYRVLTKYLGREVLHHRSLCHPHIIKFYEFFQTTHYVVISMEYANGSSLFELVQENGRLQEALARWIFQQLVIAIDYCYRRGIASRDIKLENTLLQRSENLPLPLVKICDFGYSKSDEESPATSRVGSLLYMAPELVSDPTAVYDASASDVWALGVMLYAMLYGRLPFMESTPQETVASIIHLHWSIPPQPAVSDSCKDLLLRLLTPLPGRITIPQIYQHPWFLSRLALGAATLNDQLMQQPAEAPEGQSVESINNILQEVIDALEP